MRRTAWPSSKISELMYPKNHPYHWPVIGYMEDLTAASAEDVREFFRKYYAPQNASLVVAGDINPAEARKKVEHWFADVKPGKSADPIEVPPVVLPGIVKDTLTDQVQLPRLYLVWVSPALYAPGDAELDVVASILAGGKNSRLYKRLVYDMQVAQNVVAFQVVEWPRLAIPHRQSPRGPRLMPPAAVTGEAEGALWTKRSSKLRMTPPDATARSSGC